MNAVGVESGTPGLDPKKAGEIRSYLAGLLATKEFAATRRRGQLLRYLVEQKLAGEADRISEYGIGLDVFEKPASFDPRTEATVRVEVSRLRKALEEHYQTAGAEDAWRIRVPSRGYVAEIEQVAAAPSAPRRRPLLLIASTLIVLLAIGGLALARYGFPARQTTHAVAVLPFKNLTGDPQKEYLADGITDQLIDSLGAVPSLRVVARTSAFQFKGKDTDVREIGRKLEADAIVRGSLLSRNGKLHVTLDVDRSADNQRIASRTFDGESRDLGRLETEMVPAVLAILRPAETVATKKAPDPEAYDLFLKARALRGKGTKASFDQAVSYLNQAIERDPSYADAHAALASVYASGAGNISSEPLEYAKRARAAAATALELNPNSALAYSAEGFVDSFVMMNWTLGEQEVRKAVRLMPQGAAMHNRLGLILLAQANFPDALSELKIAEDLDPLPGGASVTVGLGYYMARRYDDALRQFAMVERLHPDLAAVHPFIGAVWLQKGNYHKALGEFQQAPALAQAYIAILLAKTGKQADARKILDVLEHPKPEQPQANAFDVAAIYAALGDRDMAFHWLDLAYERRMIWFLKVHPALDPLRGDPRFKALLVRAGFN